MQEKVKDRINGSLYPLGAILILFGVAITLTFFFQMASIYLIATINGISFMEVNSLMTPPVDKGFKTELLIIQAITSIGGFIVSAWLYLRFISHLNVGDLFPERTNRSALFLLTVGITILFMIPNSVVIEWNMNIDLPDSQLEQQLRNLEDMAMEFTRLLTEIDSFGYFLLAFIVIAVIPGIGEELLFRGVLQNQIFSWLKNKHVAIWLAAILFGAIHLQFYGVVPRILLGALFGYLYYWSGSLVYSVVAHVTNNGFMVIMLYLYQQGSTNYNVEEEKAAPVWAALLGLIAVGVLMYFFKSKASENIEK